MSKCSLLADLSLFTYCYIIRFNPAYLLTGVENLADLDRLMSGTDTETVKLLLDTGHLCSLELIHWQSLKNMPIASNTFYKGWLMVEAEQDPNHANPLEDAIMARSYLPEVTGL